MINDVKLILEKIDLELKRYAKNYSKEMKPSLKLGREVVTEHDVAIEQLIVNVIKEQFKSHDFVTEEIAHESNNSEYVWYIDPIDNTVGFLANETEVVTSISLKKKDEYLYSYMYNWRTNKSYYSSEFPKLKDTDISIYDRQKGISTCAYVSKNYFKTVNQFYNNLMIRRIPLRISGSAAHDLLLVAEGKRYAHVSLAAHPWDVEAGFHFVLNSGGKVKILNNFPEKNCVAFIAARNDKIVSEIENHINW